MASADFLADADDWRVVRDPVFGRARVAVLALEVDFANDDFCDVVATIVSCPTDREGTKRSTEKRCTTLIVPEQMGKF
jgi:hypothetical protein